MQGTSTGRGGRNDRPSLRQLNDHVVQAVEVMWRDLGLQLLNNGSALDIIETDHNKHGVERCCQEMFTKWLIQENASWDQLLEALRSPSVQLMDLANKIEQKLDASNNYDTTEDESTEIGFAFQNWLTSDQKVIMLIVVVVVTLILIGLVLTSDPQFIGKNITIVPAIIGLILQPGYFVKKTALIIKAASPVVKRIYSTVITVISPVTKRIHSSPVIKRIYSSTVTAISPVIKRRYSSTVTAISPVVKRGAMTFVMAISPVVKRIDSTVVTAIKYAVRKPYTIVVISQVLASKFNLSPTATLVVCLSAIILTATFNHLHFAKKHIRLALLFTGIVSAITWIVTKRYENTYAVVIAFSILLLWFGQLSELHSHEIVYIAITLSICRFTYDLMLSLVEILDFITELLLVIGSKIHLFLFILICSLDAI